MPTLPPRPSLEHLKKQAKRLLKNAKAEKPDALTQVGPYFGDPSKITLQQAQLVLARDYGFSSWLRLKSHVESGAPKDATTEQNANRFLDLVCLHYGPDSSRGAHNFQQAAELLDQHPQIATHSLHCAAAVGDAQAVSDILARDPDARDAKGGPFQWTPLMYAAYARLPDRSSIVAGQTLLDAGANPNAHYMWGGTYRFAVLTGIFGDGEGGKKRLPEHPDMVPFARAVLDAGANPNDSQGAYNRCFSPSNTHLELMLEYGLKDSDPSDWWLTETGNTPEAHRTMHFQLIIALRWGFAERARLLIEHGVDLNTPDNNYYPTFTRSYTPYQVALMRGKPEIAELIKAKGGDAKPLSPPEQFQAACMAGDLKAAHALAKEHLGKNLETDAELLREAAGNGNLPAVETMIAIGFELSPPGTRTALHAAAWRGHVDVLRALIDAGADSKLRDPEHFSAPLGHALHGQNQPAIDLLMEAEMDIFLASSMGKIDQIDARVTEDASWVNAQFSRVRPMTEREWPNDWAPPLWFAAVNGRENSTRHLLQLGADPNVTDPAGKAIADYAREVGHLDLAELIETVAGGED